MKHLPRAKTSRLLILAATVLICNALTFSSYARTKPRKIKVPDALEELSQPTMRTRVQSGVRIPMRDGVNLVADLIFPEPEGRYSTILVRSPYGRRME